MKYIILIVILQISIFTHSQIRATIINSETKEKIPFVNIWVQNKNIGTTSDENGEFELDINDTYKISFSAIGYENLVIDSDSIKSVVALKPKITQLPKIIITSKRNNKKTIIGKFKKSKINYYFACGKRPWISARFFDYISKYNETPFLKTIKVLTKSYVKDAKFIIRLYDVNEKGAPGDYIFSKNIFGYAKKGKHITEIDLNDLRIKFPKKGFFVAIEWLIIKNNKYEYKYTLKGSQKKHKGISYQPTIGTVPVETNNNSWIYKKGIWRKIKKNNGPIKRYKNKYNLIAIELTLTN